MAQADGTILINTEIKKDGAIDDIGSLKEALRELTTVVKDMTTTLTNAFSGTKQSSSASKQFDDITKSAQQAEASVLSLEEQMDKITIQRYDAGNDKPDDGVRRDIYGRDVDEIRAKNKAIEESTRSTTAAVEQDFKEAEQGPSMLSNAIDMTKRTISDMPSVAQMAGNRLRSAFENGASGAVSIGDKVDRLKERLYSLEKQGLYFGDKEYDQAYGSLKKAEVELEQYKKQLGKVDGEQKKTTKSNKTMNKGLKDTQKNANGARMSLLGMLGRSLLFSTVFRALSVITNGLKEGTENIARYSKSTNVALSSLMSSLTMLKNSIAASFAPIVTAAAPALSKLISLLAEANNWIGQTMAALAGKDTFVKAVAVQEDYAASLSDTQKAVKEAAKEAKKATFAFDTLIQAQKPEDEKYKGPTPDQMFKTEQVSTEAKTLADNVKKTLSDLFQPIKDSWAQYGPSTIAAVQTMFGSLKRLASDVGASFMQVWKDEGYGKAITDDLLITFTNFSLTIANLADQFDKAWTEAETGTSIMRHLGDLVLVVTGFFREASESIKNWAASLDFGPLLRAFDGLLVSLVPVVQKVGGVLLWLLDNILLPIAKWAIEQALPAVLELISAGFNVLNSVLDALKPLALWLWEEFLKPLGEWTGEIIIGAIKLITEKLKDFSDWIKDHKEDVLLMTEYVLAFFSAWKVAEFVSKITNMISKLGSLGGALVTLVSKLDLTKLAFLGVLGATAALVTGALEVYKNWDKMTPTDKVISMLLLAAGAAATLAVATNAVRGPAAAALTAAAIGAGIVAALIAVSAGSRSAASGSSSSGGGGSRSFATSSPYATYSSNIPHLATGTVVPPKAGNFLAMLGDNNKDYEVVSPLGTIRQAVDEALDARGGLGGGGSITVIMEVDGTKFGQAVYKYNNKESQRIGARMVMNGG